MSDFNVKAILRMTGLTAETLRAWERRYGAVKPRRSEGGRRIYSSEELNRLQLLSILVRRGFRIGDIATLSDRELTRRVEASREGSAQAASSARSRGVSDLIEALDRFDLEELRTRFARVRFQLSPREFALELVPALMARVGQLIMEDRITIPQEHALSHVVKNELRLIYDSLEPLDGLAKPERRMLFGTREGDFHDIGLILGAILCRSHGIRCQYLGPNLPADSMSSAVRKLRPHALVLGLSFLPDEEERVTPTDFLRAMDSTLPAATELWIGGSAVMTLKTPRSARTIHVFESLHDLEDKLKRAFRAGQETG